VTEAGLKVIGAERPRRDAEDKVTGAARFTVDVALPGMLHAKVLRSPLAHARIVRIDASRARAMPGVRAVLTRSELKGLNPTYGYFIKDQPIVAIDKVRYIGDTVAAVAADDEATAVAALARIVVDYDELPTVATIDEALAPNASELFETAPPGIVPAYGTGASGKLRPARNVCYRFAFETGPEDAWSRCDHVFEDTFVFGRQQHFHLEPFVTVARVEGRQIEIWTSCQNPFPLRKELARVLNHPENLIRVHVPYVGGGYGAKNNCKTEPIAILLARMAGRPVRFCLTTEENFLTQTQHAAILELKTGVMKDGTFVAREGRIRLNAGAYADASPLVSEKAGYRLHGVYRWQRVRTMCDCVMTNTSPAGPFRGFGGTQASWASESQVDMIARRLGLDPYDIRMKNLLRLGDPYVPGESGMDSDIAAGLRLVADRIGYHKREKRKGRGIGLSVGFKDSGGVNKPAQARVKVATGGDVFLHCGSIEIGQGITTAMTAVVAEILNAPFERVQYMPVNTDSTPFDQGTNASSGISVMGRTVAQAAQSVRDQALAFAAERLGCRADELVLEDWTVRRGNEAFPLNQLIMRAYGGTGFEFAGEGYVKAEEDHHAPLETRCASWEYGWGAAEVEVDFETGRIDVKRLIVSGDAGQAINELVCRGQDEGSAIMGLGGALFETMLYDGPHLLNGDALTYRLPLATDVPDRFESILQEQGHGPGPFGAKGVGEGGLLPVASAIANAVEDAIGVRVTEMPLTPERVLAAIDKVTGRAGYSALFRAPNDPEGIS
jgi:CO/xanthine dehydrogenase Mo-binding subunit